MNTKTFTISLAAAALVAAFAGGAQAADLPQVKVGYADLNVHSTAGATVLNHRIQAAAEQVCGAFADRDPARRVQFNACTSQAVTAALAAVHDNDFKLASAK